MDLNESECLLNLSCKNFSNSIFNNASAPVGLTQAELWIQLIVFYILLCGIFSTVANIIMVAGIVSTKKLRSRFFIVICSLLIIRTLISSQMFVMGVYRSLRTVNLVETNIKRVACFAIHFHVYYATFTEMLLILFLVIDRTMAIVTPNYYRNLTTRQATCACIVVFIFSLVAKLPWMFVSSMNEIIPCINVNSPNPPILQALSQNLDLVGALAILLIYSALLLYLRWFLLPKLKKASDSASGHSILISLKRQMKLLPLLRSLVLIHCGLAITSRALLALAPWPVWPMAVSLRLTAYGGMLLTVDLFANSVMLLATNTDLREASLRILMRKPGAGSVGPESTRVNRG